MRHGIDKVQKGLTLLNADALAGCAPIVYWYTNTADEDQFRVRDRSNCVSPPFTSVYGSPTYYQTHKPDLEHVWTVWELLCDDTGATLSMNGTPVHTFGVPNGSMDNFMAFEVGVPTSHAWGDYDHNGDIWFDRIKIAQGPFDPSPTPTPAPPTPTPVESGTVLFEDFEVSGMIALLNKGWTVPNSYDWRTSIDTDWYHDGYRSLQSSSVAGGQYIRSDFTPLDPQNIPMVVSFWMRIRDPDLCEKKVVCAGQTGWFEWGTDANPLPSGSGPNNYHLRSDGAWEGLSGTVDPPLDGSTKDWHFFHVLMTGTGAVFTVDGRTQYETGAPLDDEFSQIRVGAPNGNTGVAWFDEVLIERVPGARSGVPERDWASY
jgi:hypothetical protein